MYVTFMYTVFLLSNTLVYGVYIVNSNKLLPEAVLLVLKVQTSPSDEGARGVMRIGSGPPDSLCLSNFFILFFFYYAHPPGSSAK